MVRLAGVAILASNHIDVVDAAVAGSIRSEYFAKDAFNVVSVELVKDARKAHGRDRNEVVVSSSHCDSVER